MVHANHPAEFDDDVAAALARLAERRRAAVESGRAAARRQRPSSTRWSSFPNDLSTVRVMPYYLHQLDRVAGAAHFEVAEAAGRELIEHMRPGLPGYAVPRYVREEPGAAYKIGLAEP